MRAIVVCLLGFGVVAASGCGCSSGAPGLRASPATIAPIVCRPVSWACGDVAKIDARSGSRVWGVEANGDVASVVADGRGGVYVAGGFTVIAGVRRPYIAHVLADGRLDLGWRPRVWSRVSARFTQPLLALGGGRLFVSRLASRRAGPAGIVAIDAVTGVVDARWGQGFRVSGGVAPLAVAGRRLYVGATLIRGRTVVPSLAELDAETGTLAQTFHPPRIEGGEGSGINTLAAAGRRLYVGGEYDSVNSSPHNGLAAVNSTSGRLVASWRPRLSRCGECVRSSLVFGIAVGRGGVYVAAATLRVDYARRHGAALVDTARGAVLGWAPRVAGSAQAIVLAGGRVYVGGDFTRVDGAWRNRFAAVDARTGRVLRSWQPSSATSAVLALSADANSVFVGTVIPAS